ncbi:MAG: division/cell wall cluster transcriptional repressor MraZ [Coriobacteriaceae bacterium]|nr:division/cell wall cluster transcriptional repressor MraZ [Coriobacteriaceae bacterium]
MYLTGTYDRNLDAKGRLTLPSAFRKQLEDTVRVLPAPEKEVDALYVFTEDTFKDWLDSVFAAKGGFDPTNKAHRVVMETLNGAATTLEIDSAARISLPEAARGKANLDREVTVVGNGDRLVIWDRATHEARQAEAENILADFFDN